MVFTTSSLLAPPGLRVQTAKLDSPVWRMRAMPRLVVALIRKTSSPCPLNVFGVIGTGLRAAPAAAGEAHRRPPARSRPAPALMMRLRLMTAPVARELDRDRTPVPQRRLRSPTTWNSESSPAAGEVLIVPRAGPGAAPAPPDGGEGADHAVAGVDD